MKLETLEQILNDLRRTHHVGLNSHSPCDLEKIGSPGRPYRRCTCGLDGRIAEVEREINQIKSQTEAREGRQVVSLEQIGGTHYCPVCGEEDYPAIHVCVKALQAELTRLRAENELYKKGHESDCKALAELEDENEELRKALEALLRNLPYCHRCRNDDRLLAERGCPFCDAKSHVVELLNRKTP